MDWDWALGKRHFYVDLTKTFYHWGIALAVDLQFSEIQFQVGPFTVIIGTFVDEDDYSDAFGVFSDPPVGEYKLAEEEENEIQTDVR